MTCLAKERTRITFIHLLNQFCWLWKKKEQQAQGVHDSQ